jgi:CubicO group peptidase (beta-lactamase class C family)
MDQVFSPNKKPIFPMAFLLVALLILFSGQAAADRDDLPATVVVVFDRETISPVVVEGYGSRATGRKVKANDPVRIASISKLLMALTALRLVDEGRIGLHEDISTYLDWPVRSPHFPKAPVTLTQLLSHRAGLSDAAGYVIPLGESLRERLDNPLAWSSEAPPGAAPFEYANLGAPVIATVLEAATREPYDQLMQEMLFDPLNIDACLNWLGCDEKQQATAVVLYRDTGDIARDDPADLPPNCTIPVAEGSACDLSNYLPGTNASVFSPQGGVRIGMVDLARIGQVLLSLEDNTFLSPATRAALLDETIDQAPGEAFFCTYGLGIQRIEVAGRPCDDALFADGLSRWGHAGEAYGLRAGLWFDSVGGRGVAYFTTAVPDRVGPEDEGGFHPREIALIKQMRFLEADTD